MIEHNRPAYHLLDLIKTTAFAVYVFVFYELLIVPAVMDWSFYGIGVSLILSLLLSWAIPAKVRKKWVVLAIIFLLSIKSLNNLQYTNLIWILVGGLVIYIVLLFVGIFAGRIRIRHFTAVFAIAVLLTFTVDLTEIPFWSHFAVKWKSPLLYPRQTSIDYFPLQAIDVDGDGTKELVTQGNPEVAREYIEGRGKPLEPLELEKSRLLVYKWTKKGFQELKSGSYDLNKVMDALRPDYINFPYYNVEWASKEGTGLIQKFTPEDSKASLAEKAHAFGMVPFSALYDGLTNIGDRKNSLDRLRDDLELYDPSPLTMDFIKKTSLNEVPMENLMIKGSTFSGTYGGKALSVPVRASGILAAGKLTPEGNAAVLLGKNLQVIALEGSRAGSVIGELTPAQVKDISTAELFVADVNGDNIDEILLNTEYAKILQLKENGQWEVLWNSKDDSFRFEDFDTLGTERTPEIIALSKSTVRNNRTRYLTGYELGPQGLVTKWRVFTGPINLDATDVDGDGQNELIGYSYKNHTIFVLEKHNIPVTLLLYILTGSLFAYGMYYRFFTMKNPKEVA